MRPFSVVALLAALVGANAADTTVAVVANTTEAVNTTDAIATTTEAVPTTTEAVDPICANHSCAEGFRLKPNPQDIVCEGNCSDATCCELDRAGCETFVCPDPLLFRDEVARYMFEQADDGSADTLLKRAWLRRRRQSGEAEQLLCAGSACEPAVDTDTCCEPPAPCSTLAICPAGSMLSRDAPRLFCVGASCSKVADGDTCCQECAAGRFSASGEDCAECPAMTFSEAGLRQNSSTACIECAQGQFSEAGQSRCSDCPAIEDCTMTSCTSRDDAVCSECADGFFGEGSTVCIECPAILHCKKGAVRCSSGGFSSDAACVACEAGYFGGDCSACEAVPHCAVPYCTSPYDKQCLRCADGYFLSDGACTACTAITNCSSVSCTTASDQQCNACALGYRSSGAVCAPVQWDAQGAVFYNIDHGDHGDHSVDQPGSVRLAEAEAQTAALGNITEATVAITTEAAVVVARRQGEAELQKGRNAHRRQRHLQRKHSALDLAGQTDCPDC